MLKEMQTIVLGEMSLAMFIVCYLAGCLALFIKYLIGASKRDFYSLHTPNRFSWTFFILDNGRKMLANLLILFVGIIGGSYFIPEGVTLIGALIFGFIGIEGFKSKYLTSQKKETMEYKWIYTVNDIHDLVYAYNGTEVGELSLEQFGENYGYSVDGKDLVTEVEPANGEDTALEMITVSNVKYIRRPIRVPK